MMFVSTTPSREAVMNARKVAHCIGISEADLIKYLRRTAGMNKLRISTELPDQIVRTLLDNKPAIRASIKH
jgi:hypothetical protein